ncbi:hypothetical protein TNCV_3574931 [Trichonephila clavipes]|nr:hypothetical protein TNCV_3574931 [Trichonephila clavipes]
MDDIVIPAANESQALEYLKIVLQVAYRYLQKILNSTFQRSSKMTPFELLSGTKMKSCQDIEIVELLNDEITAQLQENNVMLSVKMPKSRSTKFKMRIAVRTISGADKLININYMT